MLTEPLLVPPDGQKRRCVRDAGTQQRRQEKRMRRVILAAVMFCFCMAVVIVVNLQSSLSCSACWLLVLSLIVPTYLVLLERM